MSSPEPSTGDSLYFRPIRQELLENGQLSPCLCYAPAATRRVIPYSSLIPTLSPALYFEGVISLWDIHWTSKRKLWGYFYLFIYFCFVSCMEIACFLKKEWGCFHFRCDVTSFDLQMAKKGLGVIWKFCVLMLFAWECVRGNRIFRKT